MMDDLILFSRFPSLSVYDLLRPQNPALAIREDTDRGAYVENLFEQRVETAAECLEVMQKGVANRRLVQIKNKHSAIKHLIIPHQIT